MDINYRVFNIQCEFSFSGLQRFEILGVLLTVHLGIILVINQLNAQNLVL